MSAGTPSIMRSRASRWSSGAIVDLQEAALLQVRRRDAPAAAKVVIQAVADDVAKCLFRLELRLELQVGVFRVACKRQCDGIKNLLREDLVAEATSIRGTCLQ